MCTGPARSVQLAASATVNGCQQFIATRARVGRIADYLAIQKCGVSFADRRRVYDSVDVQAATVVEGMRPGAQDRPPLKSPAETSPTARMRQRIFCGLPLNVDSMIRSFFFCVSVAG